MIITVIGASGATGRAVLDEALGLGHSIRALVRNPDSIESREGIHIVAGSIDDQEAVSEVLLGADAVITALGTKSKFDVDLCERGARAIFSDMPGGTRLVAVSAYGAGSSNNASLYSRITRAYLGPKMLDKDRMEQLILHSDSEWTIVRPSFLRDTRSRGSCRVGPEVRMTLLSRISRRDLANYLVDAATSKRDALRTVAITA